MTDNTSAERTTFVVASSADAGPFILIETTAIPEVSQVRFYEETVPHIVSEHPEFAGELPSVIGAISSTVAEPTAVYHSRTTPGRSFVYSSEGNTRQGAPIYVVVRVVESTSGRVQTAYFSSGGNVGNLAWRASRD